MILILLALIVPSSAGSDYFAVKIENEYENYKIFTKISECKGAVYYQSEDKRVLFQDEVWKVGTLKNELDCNTVSSVVEEEYRIEEAQKMLTNDYWIDVKKAELNISAPPIWIEIKFFNKSVEVKGLNLVGGTNVEAKKKKDCLRKNWGKKYPEKDIVVAFSDSHCFYDFVYKAELEYNYRATIFLHTAGETEIRMIF